MVNARSTDALTWEHVLLVDREADEDEKSYWGLQRLPQHALTKMADATDVSVNPDTGLLETKIKLGTQNAIALRYGLVYVRNFKDPKTREEVHPRPNGEKSTPDSFIERIELSWQQELAMTIINGGSRLKPAEVEKSEPSPTT